MEMTRPGVYCVDGFSLGCHSSKADLPSTSEALPVAGDVQAARIAPTTLGIIDGNDYFLRAYQSDLRYISLSDAASLTEEFATYLTSSSIGNYVRWNMNLVATDMADGAKMGAQAWSWAENEPSTTEAGAYVLVDPTGRWVASTTAAQTYKACWSSSTLTWALVAYAESCATDFTNRPRVNLPELRSLRDQAAMG